MSTAPTLHLHVLPPEGTTALANERGTTMTETTATPKVRSTAAADAAREFYADFGTTPKDVRAWAVEKGLDVKPKGRIHPDILSAYGSDHERIPAA